MLVWTTQFPVLPNHTTTDLMMVCRRWLTGSPHFESKGLQIPEIIDGEIATASNGIHSVAIAKIENKGESHCAFRHGWQDDDKRDWMTEICGWHTGNRFFVGIHLHCATSETGTRLPPPKKPYIVRQILEDLGGDLDVDFPVSAEPQPLGEADIEIAARLLSGETDHYLPVIYASSTWQEQPPFDSQKLAQWAAGMAHVVVEPSRRFSFLLADRVGRINPYDGAVSICWPRGGGRATRLFPYHYPDQIRFATAIAETVRHALAGRRPDHRCSWDYVRGLIVREKIEAFRREGKAGIEEYVEKFDEEIQVTQRRLEEAEIEIGRLKAELANRVRGERFYSDGLLVPSSERDLYAGEQRDILVRALTIAHDNSQSGGRVKDVLAALIKANRPTGESKRIEDGIRNAMDGCDDLGKRERRELENLGFSISGEGKHLKLVFRGDDRYTFAMSKTGSDWRGMKNWISDVTKRLFK